MMRTTGKTTDGIDAQHALAADAASRRARSCLFQRQFLLQCCCHQSVAAPLKRNPLGASRFAHLSRSRITLSGAPAENCTTASTERIGREMKARYAAWFRVTFSQPRVIQRLVVLNVVPVSVVQPSAAAHIASTLVAHASTWLSISALAQHALAADAASRRARSCLFQ